MNKWTSILKLALASSFLAATVSAYAAYDSKSTGLDGAFNPTVNQSIQLPESGVFNYTTVNIPANVKITYIKNAANTPVTILATGNVDILGTIDVSGVNTDMASGGSAGPGGFDGGTAGSALILSGWVNGYTGFNIGRSGLGPGGGAPGSVHKPATAIASSNYSDYTSGGGGAYGSAPVPVGGNCSITPGVVYGNSILLPLIGGSGGGGGVGGELASGSGGGGGGGAILIASSTSINVAGSILANGGAPLAPIAAASGGGSYGGGGSGGAIHLIAPTVTGNGPISAAGGKSPAMSTYGYSVSYICANASYPTMNGGDGRIRVDTDSLTRTTGTTPVWTKGTTASVGQLSTTIPTLSIASIGGVTVPAGNSTVSLPPAFVNPVTVTFTTSNVIVGSAIKLTVTPPVGLAYTVTSGATTGTNASATASATVTLQGGSNTLQASVTYSLVVAAGDALSTYALGERVEKVTLASTLGSKETKVTLTTISGKEFVVPASVLAGIPS